MNHRHAAAATVCLILAAGQASAQHIHLSHHHRASSHHGVHYGHHNWHHVVPHHRNHVGAYYTIGHSHYYTPSPVVRIVTVAASPVASPPPAIVEAQKPVELTFGGFSRFEDLAGRLSFEANAMCLDLHYNYKHNKNFAPVYAQAYGVLQAAKYLRGKDHGGDRETIRKRMVEVDRLFHMAQEEMRGWTRAATKQIVTDALPEKIAGVEAVLHHLSYDVGIQPHESPVEEAPPPADPAEPAPPPLPERKL